MTGTARHDLVARLRAAGCVFAEDEACVLLETASDEEDLAALTARRVTGEPLEHVVGFVDFCGVRAALEPGVFIPRQRSALLVRTAAELAPASPIALDLCCGCGALGMAFAALRPDAEVHAADVDPAAVANAERNLASVYEGDLFDALPDLLRGRLDIVLANVPYVPTAELDGMPVEARDHEPSFTHDGGGDGLGVLERVLAHIHDWVRPGGHLVVEVADEQRPVATTLFENVGLDVRFDYSDELDTTVAVGTV